MSDTHINLTATLVSGSSACYEGMTKIEIWGIRGEPSPEMYYSGDHLITLYLPAWEAKKLAGNLAAVEKIYLDRAQSRADEFMEAINKHLVV
jgi:hypothetical protein